MCYLEIIMSDFDDSSELSDSESDSESIDSISSTQNLSKISSFDREDNIVDENARDEVGDESDNRVQSSKTDWKFLREQSQKRISNMKQALIEKYEQLHTDEDELFDLSELDNPTVTRKLKNLSVHTERIIDLPMSKFSNEELKIYTSLRKSVLKKLKRKKLGGYSFGRKSKGRLEMSENDVSDSTFDESDEINETVVQNGEAFDSNPNTCGIVSSFSKVSLDEKCSSYIENVRADDKDISTRFFKNYTPVIKNIETPKSSNSKRQVEYDLQSRNERNKRSSQVKTVGLENEIKLKPRSLSFSALVHDSTSEQSTDNDNADFSSEMETIKTRQNIISSTDSLRLKNNTGSSIFRHHNASDAESPYSKNETERNTQTRKRHIENVDLRDSTSGYKNTSPYKKKCGSSQRATYLDDERADVLRPRCTSLSEKRQNPKRQFSNHTNNNNFTTNVEVERGKPLHNLSKRCESEKSLELPKRQTRLQPKNSNSNKQKTTPVTKFRELDIWTNSNSYLYLDSPGSSNSMKEHDIDRIDNSDSSIKASYDKSSTHRYYNCFSPVSLSIRKAPWCANPNYTK